MCAGWLKLPRTMSSVLEDIAVDVDKVLELEA
jgi:hypothetical protein